MHSSLRLVTDVDKETTLRSHSLSAMQHVKFLQLPHILFQDWVLKKVVQHVTAQSLEGNINLQFSLHAFGFPIFGVTPQLLPS